MKSEFNITGKDHVFIAAEGALKLIPGSSYSIGFAVSTVVGKYLNHLPLERQCRMMDSLGLQNMKPQVLYNLAKVVSIYLEPIAERIRSEILNNLLIHSDETSWPINNSKDSAFLTNVPTLSDAIAAQLFERYGDVQAFALNQVFQKQDTELMKNTLNEYVKLYSIYDVILFVSMLTCPHELVHLLSD